MPLAGYGISLDTIPTPMPGGGGVSLHANKSEQPTFDDESFVTDLRVRTTSDVSTQASMNDDVQDVHDEDLEPLDTGNCAVEGRIAIWACCGHVQSALALAVALESYGYTVRMFVSSASLIFCKSRGIDVCMVRSRQQVVNADKQALKDFGPHVIINLGDPERHMGVFEKSLRVPEIPVVFSVEALKDFLSQADNKGDRSRPMFLAASRFLGSCPPGLIRGLHHTGPWVLEDWAAPGDIANGGRLEPLRRFLQTGPRPVAIARGEGSPSQMLDSIAQELTITGHRLVLLDFNNSQSLFIVDKDSVRLVPDVPQAWLLQQCSCMVHGGGPETTHTALLACLPSVIVPRHRVQQGSVQVVRCGAGVIMDMPTGELSAEKLAKALRDAEERRDNAWIVGGQMRGEGCEAQAAQVVDAFLRKEIPARIRSQSLDGLQNSVFVETTGCKGSQRKSRKEAAVEFAQIAPSGARNCSWGVLKFARRIPSEARVCVSGFERMFSCTFRHWRSFIS